MSTYAERLNKALALRGMSQSELARLIEVKPQSIQYLCTSKVKNSRFTFEIAHVLNINPNWLALGKGHITSTENQKDKLLKNSAVIPIINWSDLYDYFNTSDFGTNRSDFRDMVVVENSKENCFALKVPDNSMLPIFETNSLIILEPIEEPIDLNEKYVLTYLFSDKTYLFRKLIKSQNEIKLVPLNTKFFNEITLNKNDKLLGFLVENRTEY